jgi:FtsP/CotA-like multicopper oxidase with cupredoxin domain
VNRRSFLGLGVGAGAGLALAACSSSAEPVASPALITPTDPIVARVEAARAGSGRVTQVALTAAPTTIDLAGRHVATWAYGGKAGGPEIRARVGDTLRVTLANKLPDDTTVHWHGIAIRNDMDGVSPVTQRPVAPGGTFNYEFVLPDAGTYWYHPHVGLQADRGLYGPLIVEDPSDTSGVDVDHVLVFDDWLDGFGVTPDEVLQALNPALGGEMAGMDMGSSSPSAHTASPAAVALLARNMKSSALGGITGHIRYPMHLINGRPAADRETITVPDRGRIRLRLINAAAETPYRFAIGGHSLTVTHADGFPVEPVQADSLLLGMGERYDVLVTPAAGAWPIVAAPEGKPGLAAAVLRTRGSVAPAPSMSARPAELARTPLAYSQLRPAESASLPVKSPTRNYHVSLINTTGKYLWGIAGKDAATLQARRGERVRITMTNSTPMWHPMHLHGHTFALPSAGGTRKDTVNILPGQKLAIDFDADNPGAWMFHCHNAYHFEAGMSANFNYVK